MEIKKSLVKFSLIGLTALMAFNALAVQPQNLFNQTVGAAQAVQTAVAQVDAKSMLDTSTITKEDMLSAITDTLQTATEKYDLANGVDVSFASVETKLDALASQSSSSPVYKELCSVIVASNESTGKSSTLSQDTFVEISNKLVKYSEAERKLMNEFIVNHEIGHCGFTALSNPFKIGDTANVNSLINNTFGDVAFRLSLNQDGYKDKFIVSPVGDLLNESYAEAAASVAMIKTHDGSSQVIKFLNKVSFERDLSVAMTKRVVQDGVNPYDIGEASKLAVKPEMVKKIVETTSNAEMKEIILDIANQTMLTSLAKKSDKELSVAFGDWQIKEQAEITVSTFDVQYKPGGLASEAAKKVLDAQDKAEVNSFLEASASLRDSMMLTQEAANNARDLMKKNQADWEKMAKPELSSHASAVSAFKSEVNTFKVENGLEGAKKASLDEVLKDGEKTFNISTSGLKEAKEIYRSLDLKDAPKFSDLKYFKM